MIDELKNDIPMPEIPLWRRNDVGNAIYEFWMWWLYNVDNRQKIGILLTLPLVLTVAGFLLYCLGMIIYLTWCMGEWPSRLLVINLILAGLGWFIMRRSI